MRWIIALVWMATPVASGRFCGDDDPSPEKLAAVADALAPSIVFVEYVPQYDKGESPGQDRWRAWAAYSRGQQGGASPDDWEDWDELIREERPGMRPGFLIAPDLVWTADPMVHPRFIRSITVRSGAASAPARPAAYFVEDDGYLLRLDAPLPGAVPLAFDPGRAGPYLGVTVDRRDGVWTTRAAPLSAGAAVAADGRRFTPGSANMLVVDLSGGPVTICGRGERAIDGSWKLSPSARSSLTAAQMDEALDRLEDITDRAVLRVRLEFRSPRGGTEGGHARTWYAAGDDDETVATEWNGLGLLVNETRMIVFASLKPRITARLERIKVFTSDGRELSASFAGSLRDWGALLVTLDAPAAGAVTLDTRPVTAHRGRLLLKAEIGVRGETRTAYLGRERVASFYPGFRGELFPYAAPARDEDSESGDSGDGSMNFLFTREGTLVGAAMRRREKVTVENRWDAGRLLLAPASVVAALVRDPAAVDPDNTPLSEDDENRLAWLGVEMQPMEPELARANGVSDLTRGGASGGIVSYVYPNSPAVAAGLRIGDILLRLQVEGHPRPLEVQLQATWGGGMLDQFWSMLDQVPDEYLDRMPTPWGSAENTLNRALTEVGFGTPIVAEVFRDGRVIEVPMAVTQGPPHYEAARRFKSEPAGVTVRDLTYEVRRFFLLSETDPGVIVSKVERGGRAAVAGIKPFEIITAVNDRPITSSAEFERAIAPGGEFKLDVKRMTAGRVVKIRVDAAK